MSLYELTKEIIENNRALKKYQSETIELQKEIKEFQELLEALLISLTK